VKKHKKVFYFFDKTYNKKLIGGNKLGIVKSKQEPETRNEMIVTEQEELHDSDILNRDINFEDKVDIARKVANTLKNVIEGSKMYATINNKKYVTVEGWSTLGTCLGVYAYVEEVKPIQTKKRVAYQATVSIRNNTGQIFSRASAISTSGEKNRQDDFAIYSMAQTRATGKAFRLALSWIMNLAGYEPTPAEEMSEIERKEAVKKAKAKTKKEPEFVQEAEIVNKN
jgi:hypothetical protein